MASGNFAIIGYWQGITPQIRCLHQITYFKRQVKYLQHNSHNGLHQSSTKGVIILCWCCSHQLESGSDINSWTWLNCRICSIISSNIRISWHHGYASKILVRMFYFHSVTKNWQSPIKLIMIFFVNTLHIESRYPLSHSRHNWQQWIWASSTWACGSHSSCYWLYYKR